MITNEIEKKSIITEDEYKNLVKYFSAKLHSDYKLQINYYYDTEDYALNKKGETLRIRQINDNLRLEYKYDKKTVDDSRVCKRNCKTAKNNRVK